MSNRESITRRRRQAEWVQSATAGGDAEALLGIDQEGWFPLRIRASEFEVDVIDAGWIEIIPADR